MARCSYCDAETQLYVNGSPVCIECSEQNDPVRKPPQSSRGNLADVNASLNAARDAYRQALRAQLEASALGQSLDPGNPDGSMALRNANHQLELASARYEEALREFVANTSVRRRSC
jgi:hypothetical protein